MSLEDRISQAGRDKKAQEEAEEAEKAASLARVRNKENARVQAWTQFDRDFKVNRDLLNQYVRESGLSNLLERAKRKLQANMKNGLHIEGDSGSPQPINWWNDYIRGNIRGPYKSSAPDASKAIQVFTLSWNFGKISYLEESWDYVVIEVDVPGAIIFKGHETFTDPKAIWTAAPALLEQHLGDVALSPQSHEVRPYHPPSRN